MSLAAVMVANSGWLPLPLPALVFLSYCGLLGGMLLAWRFHSSRVFYCLLVLLLAHQALPSFAGGPHGLNPGGMALLKAITFLIPLNFALFSLMEERGLTVVSFAPVSVFLFVQMVIVAVLWRSAESGLTVIPHARHASAVVLPTYILFTFVAAAVILVAGFLFTRKAVDSSFLWALTAFYLSLRNVSSAPISELYVSAAAYILVFSIIENSYILAYHDELTSLPSRRAFNDATLRLQNPYSLAVVDIDHFKRFNDTYGHEVGDQVLRLVAAKLAEVTGGGKVFRCGGEEFNVLFPGKSLPEVTEHLERLRLNIESAQFRMRGQDRRQLPRGPDRRDQTGKRKRRATPSLSFADRGTPAALSVTVSIGAAASRPEESNPQIVLESADKALYRAKENGRNRVEIAAPKRRSKPRAAGIA